MENIKVAIHLTEEAQGKQGIRIECDDEIIFHQIYENFLSIQPRISKDSIFKTAKRLIINSSYIDDLEKLAEKLLKINNIQYQDFFNSVLNIRNKIHMHKGNFSNHLIFK